MGQVLHKRARTTEEVRRDIQNSQESLIKLSIKYGVNPKTIQKWKKRDFTHDAKMGPKVVKSTVLSEAEGGAAALPTHVDMKPAGDTTTIGESASSKTLPEESL